MHRTIYDVHNAENIFKFKLFTFDIKYLCLYYHFVGHCSPFRQWAILLLYVLQCPDYGCIGQFYAP